jgi:hypothetical protein
MLSMAAYRGLWQLLRDPFFWEKTQHGISRHESAQPLPAQIFPASSAR